MTDDANKTDESPLPQANGTMAEPQTTANSRLEPGADAVAALEAEKNELRDKLLRTLADMENLRRRTEREIADARSYGITGFARDMLGVADNLHRALESLPKEVAGAAEGPLKALIEGIDLTERDLLKILERHGVKKIDPAGQKFDPNLHQAMFEAPDGTVPKGTVLQVVQVGYGIGDRVLRPALVGVSAGGPRPAEPSTEATPATDPVDRKA